MEQNIEGGNVNQNNLNNNINNQDININNNNNENRNSNYLMKLFQEAAFSFIIFFSINSIIYLYSKIIPIETYKYVFQYFPIVKHYQFYRVITRYFIHFGIFHLLIELIAFFYLSKTFENMFGTLLTISIIFTGMIIDSIVQLLLIPSFSIFLRGRISLLYNYFYEGGLTPLLFTLITYFSLYRNNKNQQFSFESIFILRAKYSYFYVLGILYFFTPNRTFYGNVSGIIGGHILKKFPTYLLPNIKSIKDMEDYYSLNKIKILYRPINFNNKKMKAILTEYDKDSIEDIIESNNIDENTNNKNNIEFDENEADNNI